MCVNICAKVKNSIIQTYEGSKVAHNKTFWKTIKNFFPDKSSNFKTVTLVESNMVISDNQKLVYIFIEYIDSTVPKLGLAIPKDVIIATNGIQDPVLKDILVYLQ